MGPMFMIGFWAPAPNSVHRFELVKAGWCEALGLSNASFCSFSHALKRTNLASFLVLTARRFCE